MTILTACLRITLVCLATLALPAAEEPRGKGGKGGAGGETPKGAIDLVTAAKPNPNPAPTFTLSSPALRDGGVLPAEFTGDGAGASLPLTWSNVPRGTVSLALVMHHLDPEGKTKVYWLVVDIDPGKTSVVKNASDFGRLGLSTVHDRVEYAPPHSKGPGLKKYVLTLFALSAKPDLPDATRPVSLETLLPAMKGKILGAADLTVAYTRPAGASDEPTKRPARPGPPRTNGGKGD
ncbi:MAG: YbhB/YbcL family Raf kinase inhibitor-like protein [Opitutia bacterium]